MLANFLVGDATGGGAADAARVWARREGTLLLRPHRVRHAPRRHGRRILPHRVGRGCARAQAAAVQARRLLRAADREAAAWSERRAHQ